jgi:hypothetical protein
MFGSAIPLASDDAPQNQNLWVQFYPGTRPNNFRSRETGKPEFDNVDFIRKVAGGNPNNVIERPATEQDKRDFPMQWAAYQNKQTYRPTSGTLLEDWPRLDAATRAKLKALEFHTVEQIAEASDGQINTIGMGCYELRNLARAYIKAAKDTSFAQKQAEDLAARDQEIADLRNSLNQALAQIEELRSARTTDAAGSGGNPEATNKPPRGRAASSGTA